MLLILIRSNLNTEEGHTLKLSAPLMINQLKLKVYGVEQYIVKHNKFHIIFVVIMTILIKL